MADLDQLQGAIKDVSDPMVVIGRVVDQALRLIPAAEGATVELAAGGQLTYVAAAGTLATHVGTRLRLHGSLSGLAVRSAETLYCADASRDARVDRAACLRVGAVSMVCVPLYRDAETIGALKVTSPLTDAFSAGDARILTALSGFIAAAIGAVFELARLTGELLESRSPGLPLERAGVLPTSGLSAVSGDAIGEFVANVLAPGVVTDVAAKARIQRAIDEHEITMCGQPIVELQTGELVGVEALARFSKPPGRPPDVWFAEAEHAGLGVPLQLAAVRAAVPLLAQLPESAFLAINVGPDAIAAAELQALLGQRPERLVLELTEHLKIDDYPHLSALLAAVRRRGTRLAIDDTGAGFSSLGHIVNLAPELIKLDRQFTQQIDRDPVRRSLAHALVRFARDTGAQVVAEGIETEAELRAVRELAIPYGQGYILGRPGPVEAIPHRFPSL